MGSTWPDTTRRLCCLCIALFLALMIPPPSAHASSVSNASFNALIRKAVKARKKGDLERASEFLRQAIALNSMPELLNNLGMVYAELGRYSDAVDMYQKVVEHPEAKDDLKRLDKERITLLEPKLTRGWIVLETKHKSLQVFIDRAVQDWKRGAELEAPPGRCVLQVTSDDGSRTQLGFLDLPAGRRTTVNLDLQHRPRRMGRALWNPEEIPAKYIRVDDYTLAGDVTILSGIHLQPGAYSIRFGQRDKKSITQAMDSRAGEAFDLSVSVRAAPMGADPIEDSIAPQGLPVLPMAAVGMGIALSGVGGALLYGAQTDRDRVSDAEGADGVMTIPMAEAVELQSSANDKASTGAILVGLGVAATITGLAWWWTTGQEPSEDQAFWLSPAPDGLAIGGRF